MQSLSSNRIIKKYWVIENSNNEYDRLTKPMISDGCVEIMILEGNKISMKINEEEQTYLPGLYVAGQLNGMTELRLYPSTKIHFLKLYPWVNPILTNFYLVDITNRCIPLIELNKSLDKKIKRYNPSTEISKIIEVVIELLEYQSSTNANLNIILESCRKILRDEQDFQIIKKEILQDFNISAKTLENKFKRHIGLTPKQFSMTIRMRKVVEELIYNRTSESLTTIAHKNGFFDQSHFIRSFRALLGAAPTQLALDSYLIPYSDEHFRFYTI
ncbi:MAG: helix-turn-helix domain-containing protein [Thermonemataceae bacterium]